jgi:hypothetical protein
MKNMKAVLLENILQFVHLFPLILHLLYSFFQAEPCWNAVFTKTAYVLLD